MELEITVEGKLVNILQGMGGLFRDAADEAVRRTTDEAKEKARDVIEDALSPKAAFTLTSTTYERDGGIKGYLHERWAHRGGKFVLGAFAAGATVSPLKGGYLTIPLRAAGSRIGRFRPTVARWLANVRGSLDLRLVPRGNGSFFLVAQLVQGGSPFRLNKKGKLVRSRARRAKPLPFTPVFLLVKETRVPKKLNMAPVEAFIDRELGEQLTVALAKRGLDL